MQNIPSKPNLQPLHKASLRYKCEHMPHPSYAQSKVVRHISCRMEHQYPSIHNQTENPSIKQSIKHLFIKRVNSEN